MNSSNVIKRRAQQYIKDYIVQGHITYRSKEQLDELDSDLLKITSDHDKYYYLILIKNHIEAGLKKYLQSNKNLASRVEEINEDFLYDLQSKINQITRYENQLNLQELLSYNSYLDRMTTRIESLERELDEYQQEAINEIARLRIDLEQLTKSQAERQILGTWLKVTAFLTKAGLNHSEISAIINNDWDNTPQIGSNIYELAKTMLG